MVASINTFAKAMLGSKTSSAKANKDKTGMRTTVDDAYSNMSNANRNMTRLQSGLSTDINAYLSAASDAQRNADLYNAQQAQINRDWQQMMSSTAHQREVEDLKAAGLNPVLSANAGAAVGSGATASSSNALTGVLGDLATSAMSAVSSLSQSLAANSTSFANTATNAYASMANAITSAEASIYASDVQKYAAELSSRTSLTINQATNQMNYRIAALNANNAQICAQISGQYGLEQSKLQAYVQQNAAQLSYAASVYGSTSSATASVVNQVANNLTQKGIAKQNNKTDIARSLIGAASGALGMLTSGIGRAIAAG